MGTVFEVGDAWPTLKFYYQAVNLQQDRCKLLHKLLYKSVEAGNHPPEESLQRPLGAITGTSAKASDAPKTSNNN
jgi:hypothetical protein